MLEAIQGTMVKISRKGEVTMIQGRYILVIMLLVGCAHSQDECAALLRHGIRDYVSEVASNSNFSQSQYQMCSKYNEVNKQAIGGSANVDVPLTVGVNVSMSVESLKAVGKSLCENSDQLADSAALRQKASSIISPAALAAYSQCLALSGSHLKTTTTYIEDDTGARGVSLSMYYQPPPGLSAAKQKVTSITLIGFKEVNCSGDLWKSWKTSATGELELSGASRTIVCNRQVQNTPFQDAGRPVLAKLASITVVTTAGSITTPLAPIFPQPPEWRLHVGEIVASMLGLQEFQRAYGAGWVLADGRSVVGSAYSRITGNTTVPDLRGVFLRGKNYNRDTKQGNEDGDSKVGAFQADALRAHSHPLSAPYLSYNEGDNKQFDLVGDKANILGRTSRTLDQDQAAKETRPRNVTVNFYIRVN